MFHFMSPELEITLLVYFADASNGRYVIGESANDACTVCIHIISVIDISHCRKL